MDFKIRLKDGDFYYLNDDGEYVKVGDFYYLNDDGEYVKVGSGTIDADLETLFMDISEKPANEYVEEICEHLREMTNNQVYWAREIDMFNGYWIAFRDPNIKTSCVCRKASMLMEEISVCVAEGIMARDIAYSIYNVCREKGRIEYER